MRAPRARPPIQSLLEILLCLCTAWSTAALADEEFDASPPSSPSLFEGTPLDPNFDTLNGMMDLVLRHDSDSWDDQDFEDHLDWPYFGGEPTFVPKSHFELEAFTEGEKDAIHSAQLDAIDRLNDYYLNEYPKSASAKRFPCRPLRITRYRRNPETAKYFSRVEKLASLDGRRLVVYQCRDLQTAQEFRFLLTPDSGVIEPFTQPDLLRNMEAKVPLIQASLFDVMDSRGYRPDLDLGMGHTHIGRARFKSVEHIQRFLRYMFSHSELFDGIWVRDYLNARPLRLMTASENPERDPLTALNRPIEQKAKWIELNRIYNGMVGNQPAIYYTTEHQTVELRGNRAFKSAKAMVNIMKVLNHAVDVTAGEGEFSYTPHELKPPEQMVRDYFELVGSSLDRESARDLIMPRDLPAGVDDGIEVPRIDSLRLLSFQLFPVQSSCADWLSPKSASE